jgi:hypothetical protein
MDEATNMTDAWVGLKKIPHDATEFTASGQRYRRLMSLSIDRYEAYELLQVEIGMGRTFEQFNDEVNRAYELCNEVATGKKVFADLAVLLRDLSIGCSLLGQQQHHAVLKMCALFLVRDGEDLRTIDDQMIKDKIDDWRNEGIDMGYFFTFALLSIPGFLAAYKAVSQTTSAGEKTESKQGSPKRRSTTSNASPA